MWTIARPLLIALATLAALAVLVAASILRGSDHGDAPPIPPEHGNPAAHVATAFRAQ